MSTNFEGFPLIIGWELTLACNLNCRHCGSSAGMPRQRELTTAEALALCGQFPDLLVQEVNFTGGEPLLREDWPDIARRLAQLGLPVKILTNGLALDGDTIRRLADLGIAGVGVSIDGLATTHDRIRGRPGLHKRLLRALEGLLAVDLPLTVITTATHANLDELPALYHILTGMGVTRWQIQPVFPLGRSRSAAEFLHLSPERYLHFGRLFRMIRDVAEIDVLPGDSFGYYTGLDTREPPWRGCPAGLYSCGITSDGRVKGCLSLPDELTEGDLRRHDLWEIWFQPDAFAYTRHFTPAALGDHCRDCEYGEQCQGGCSAMSWGATGSFHNDPYCFHRIMADAG